jgi:hypothetical protein
VFPRRHEDAQIPARSLSKYHQLGGKRELAKDRSGDVHALFSKTRFKIA